MPSVRIYGERYAAEIGEQVTFEYIVIAIPFRKTVSWHHTALDGQTKELNEGNQKYKWINYHFGGELVIKDINKHDEGTYKCTIRDFFGMDSKAVYLTVKGSRPVLHIDQGSHSTTEGESVCLKCTVKATPPVSRISWEKQGREIMNDNEKYIVGSVTCPLLVIINAEKEFDEGEYTCLAENTAGEGNISMFLKIESEEAQTAEIRQYETIPEEATQEQIMFKHGELVNELSNSICPERQANWTKFKQLLQSDVPRRPLSNNLQETINYLLEEEYIRYGHYDKLYEVVFEIDRQLSHIIKKAEYDMKTIGKGGVPNEEPIKCECKYDGDYKSEEQAQRYISQVEATLPDFKGRIKVAGRSGSFHLTFTINKAEKPYELLALYLAETLRTKLEKRQIVLKDESDVPLVPIDSPRLLIPMKDKPTVRLSKGYYQFHENRNATVKCVVVSTRGIEYIKWFRVQDGKPQEIVINSDKYFGGPRSSSLVISCFNYADRGIYFCMAGNNAGEAESDTAFVDVRFGIRALESRKVRAHSKEESGQHTHVRKSTLEEQIIFRHGLMVNKLADHISPVVEMKWEKFLQLLHGYVPPIQRTKNFHGIIKYLVDQKYITHGNYDVLDTAVNSIDKELSQIIKQAASDIKILREGGVPNEISYEIQCVFRGETVSLEQIQSWADQTKVQFPMVECRISVIGKAGSIHLLFTISKAKTPHEPLALYLAETLRDKLENRQIVLKDESGAPLVSEAPPRLMIPMKDEPMVRLSKGYYQYTEGQTAIVDCVVVSALELGNIKWFRVKDEERHEINIDNRKYIGGPKVPSLSISDVNKDDSGVYFCMAANKAGEAESNTAVIGISSLDSDNESEPSDGESESGLKKFYPRLCRIIGWPLFCRQGFHLDKARENTGHYILAVERDSPAATVGIKAGDRIVEVNDINIESDSHQQLIHKVKPGETISLLVVDPETDEYYKSQQVKVHRGMEEVINVMLSYRYLFRPRLCHVRGFCGFNLHEQREDRGHYIERVDEASVAKDVGLLAGDRIIEVNGMNIESDSHREVASKVNTRDEIDLLVVDPKTDEYYKSRGVKVHSGRKEVYDIRFCYCRLNDVKWASSLGCGFDLNEDRVDNGHSIRKVDNASPAKAAGLRDGDKIIEVNNVNIEVDSHQEVMRKIKAGNEIHLLVMGPITDKYQKQTTG